MSRLPAPMVTPSVRWPTPDQMQAQLDEVRHEFRLMDFCINADPPPTPEETALYAERYVALKEAHAWLPQAIERATKRAAAKQRGFTSLAVKPEMRL